MRISDWSSDVCSSDLSHLHPVPGGLELAGAAGDVLVHLLGVRAFPRAVTDHAADVGVGVAESIAELADRDHLLDHRIDQADVAGKTGGGLGDHVDQLGAGLVPQLEQVRVARFRSEEHTSELQSLIRISYAVFCLKKT